MEAIREYELDGKLYQFYLGGVVLISDLDIEVEDINELTVKELRIILKTLVRGLYKMRKSELVDEVSDVIGLDYYDLNVSELPF